MEELEALRQWLRGFPGWGEAALHIDTVLPQPVNAGLYPLGEELLERREDLLGNVICRCRRKFILYRMVCAGKEPAAWLLEFQKWVMAQSEAGLAPRLGEESRFRAEHGHLKEVQQSGTAVYAVTLIAEFLRKY